MCVYMCVYRGLVLRWAIQVCIITRRRWLACEASYPAVPRPITLRVYRQPGCDWLIGHLGAQRYGFTAAGVWLVDWNADSTCVITGLIMVPDIGLHTPYDGKSPIFFSIMVPTIDYVWSLNLPTYRSRHLCRPVSRFANSELGSEAPSRDA